MRRISFSVPARLNPKRHWLVAWSLTVCLGVMALAEPGWCLAGSAGFPWGGDERESERPHEPFSGDFDPELSLLPRSAASPCQPPRRTAPAGIPPSKSAREAVASHTPGSRAVSSLRRLRI
ncbi:MAG: hypothetical protein ACT4QC_03310 [Planctomycetaceae bacterium]